MRKFILIVCLMALLMPVVVFARIGVGVGVGKIEVNKPLKPGMIYNLPSLPVLNTGDEPSNYGASIEYHEGQEQRADMGLKPPQEWFSFEPAEFYLEPGQVQTVAIKLNLPVKTVPGNYFAYLEGHPIREAEPGVTAIGIAAAAKLYFTVAPANIWQGIYYRVASFLALYAPWTWIILGIVIAAIIIAVFRKRFAFQIAIKKK